MSPLPVAEGGRASGGGGLGSHWMLIGGVAGVGVIAILLMKGSGGTSGTTAAGTSINAALGSIQEQNLNLMGQLGASVAALSSQASDYHDSELAALSGMQDALSGQMSALDAHMTDVNDALTHQLNDINGNVVANGQAISGVDANLTQYYQNLLSAGQSQQTATQATLAMYANQLISAISGVSNQVGGVSAQQGQLANLLQTYFAQLSGQVATVGNQVSDTWGPFMELTRGVHDLENALGMPPT